MTLFDKLRKSISNADIHNSDAQIAPACILWPDYDRQWEAVIPRLQSEQPEIFVLGDYKPEERTGPAIWLRCVIAGKIDGITLSESQRPILYLPGVSRQSLRAVENCPNHIKPLAELQYRGAIWSQLNTKDWTILAFLKSNQGGLGLDVAKDRKTLSAMQLALYRLLDEDIDLLKGKPLEKDYFNTLLTGGDPVRDLLHWLNQGETFRSGRSENEWRGFVEVCKSQLAFDPENDGILAGAAKLANHEGSWHPRWERFCEAPARYSNIPAQIRKCKAPNGTISWHMGGVNYDGWPQWNEEQENALRGELQSISSVPPHEARKRILGLEKRHSTRRKLVWAELGDSPLAIALEHLTILAEITASPLASGTVDELLAGYRNSSWQADDAVIRSLECIEKPEDIQTVTTVIRVVYLPWVEESARYLQNIVEQSGYPGGTLNSPFKGLKTPVQESSKCILFVDGLRFDIARRLAFLLTKQGYEVEEKSFWTALPSVTATGKPAVTPVSNQICGKQANADFEPIVADTEQSLKGGYHLKKLLADKGWEVLDKNQSGNGNNRVWCEFGDIDHEGHNYGWKLAKHFDGILKEICSRVNQLFNAGWKKVQIVTDHGWLLMPGGLPKIDLPSSLTENKWGRCAAIKSGAVSDERLYPWYWNPEQYFALADGISCYRKGEEYAHGGLSLQECLTLQLTVTPAASEQNRISAEITDIVWNGLRCKVAVEGKLSGLSLDVRTQAGNSSSSVVMSVKALKENGTGSVVLENEEFLGTKANVVLLDNDNQLVAQKDTVIGGGD